MSPSGNILSFPDRSPVEEEAARWVVRHDEGSLSASEKAEFETWKLTSPAHADAFARLSGHWGDLNALGALADTPAETPLIKRPAFWAGLGAAAAAAFAVLVAGGVLRSGGDAGSQIAQKPEVGVYRTEIGNQEKITLTDGTVVTLNTDSRIEARMNAQERSVRLLQGEAYFKVAHDAARPFRVYAGDGVTVAVGTAFSVRLERDEVEVIVSEGKVSYARIADVAAPEPVAYVAAGEMARFGDNVVIDKVDEAVVDRKLSWTEGRLVFAGDPLSSVVADISRYTDIQFEFATQDLADLRVGGVFDVGEVDDLLDALETNFRLRVQRVGDKLVRITGLEEAP